MIPLRNTSPKTLFFVNEAGSAAYLAPLWRLWLESQSGGDRWCVVLGEGARSWIELHGPEDLPLADIAAPLGREQLISFMTAWCPEYLVASATGFYLEAELVDFAKQAGIPSAQIVDSWYGYRSRFEIDGKLVLPNRILLIDEHAFSEAISDNLPEACLRVVGQPAWDKAYNYPPAEQSSVLFVTQPVRRFYGKKLGYDELDAWNLLLDFRRQYPERIDRLILAQHPAGSLLDSVELEDVEVCLDGSSALGKVGTVVGMFSSLMIDALLAGRSVLSLQPVFGSQDMSSLSRHRQIPRVGTVESLEKVFGKKPSGVSQLRTALQGSLKRLEMVLAE